MIGPPSSIQALAQNSRVTFLVRSNVRFGSQADLKFSVFRNSISDPRLRQNEPGVVGVVFDLLPQLADVDAKILRVFGMRRTPNRSQNLLVGQHAAGVPREEREKLEFLGC